jgi:hypothetical protein
MSEEVFPEDWPPGCPPQDAVAAAGTFFRLVHWDPPSAEDFLSPHEKNTHRKKPPCLRCALSLYGRRDEVEHTMMLYPKLGDKIAEGVLTPAHGRTKLNPGPPSSHTSWWPYRDVNRHLLFRVV